MDKKMTTKITALDYANIKKFRENPSSIDPIDKNILIDNLISGAKFENLFNERVESWRPIKKDNVWGWDNGKEFVPEEFTKYKKYRAIVIR